MKEYLTFWQKRSHRNLWQHPLWADFQNAIGHKTWSLDSDEASALIIKRHLPGGFNWLEVPRGPLWTKGSKGLIQFLSQIKNIGKKEKSVFIRFSPFGELPTVNGKLKVTKHDHHPQTSLVIDLDQTEEEILKQMKPKGRYNIKVAQKHGVTVREADDVDDFYEILSKTGSRDGFGIHSKKYYEEMLFSMPKNAQLLLAEYDDKVIAGGLFVYLDDWGIYYYGASDNVHRNLMAPYLIQLEAMKEAKNRGCKHYDFLGIAPEGVKNHPWAGVAQFKKKFGGRVVNYPKAKELTLRPFWHWMYRVYKKFG